MRIGSFRFARVAPLIVGNLILVIVSTLVFFGLSGTANAQDSSIGDGTWVWQNPLPQGSALNAVWGSSASDVWAVGEYGVILRWDGSNWSTQITSNHEPLHAVWGSDPEHIWAVGANGTILAWNGNSWITQDSGTTNDLYAIWGSSAASVWAVGSSDTILKWNGSTWTPQSSGTVGRQFRGIWGTDAQRVWVVGEGNMGTVLIWNGVNWAEQSIGGYANLRAVWGTDANHVWVVGGKGSIFFWDGDGWVLQAKFTDDTHFLASGALMSTTFGLWEHLKALRTGARPTTGMASTGYRQEATQTMVWRAFGGQQVITFG